MEATFLISWAQVFETGWDLRMCLIRVATFLSDRGSLEVRVIKKMTHRIINCRYLWDRDVINVPFFPAGNNVVELLMKIEEALVMKHGMNHNNYTS